MKNSVAETMVQEALQKMSDSTVKPLLAEIASSQNTIIAHQKAIAENGKKLAEIRANMAEVEKTMWAAFESAGA